MIFPVIPDVPKFWVDFETVKKRRGWKKITAVRNSSLYEVQRDLISRPGPRLIKALEVFAEVINPIV